MADFTIEVRTITELTDIKADALSEYPIFDEGYRDTLNDRIINHFWYREIAHETVDVWLRRLKVRMNEIMPYFNKWYLSELVKIDPLSTQDMTTDTSSESKDTQASRMNQEWRGDAHTSSTESHKEDTDSRAHSATHDEGSSKGNTTSTADAKSRAVASQLPQTRLAGNEDYATSATDTVSHNEGTGSSSTSDRRDGTADSTSHVGVVGSSEGQSSSQDSKDGRQETSGESAREGSSKQRISGYHGHSAALIAAWRETFVNVDMMVIESLEPLFMQIWNTDDEYFKEGWFW